jgi:hypothetical protein
MLKTGLTMVVLISLMGADAFCERITLFYTGYVHGAFEPCG